MAESCDLLKTFAVYLQRARWFVLGFWLFAMILGAIGAMHFLEVTTISFDPPRGSESYVANEHVEQVFPEVATATQYVTVIDAKPPSKVLELANFPNFTFALRERLNETGLLMDFKSHYTMLLEEGVNPRTSLTDKTGKTTLIEYAIADKFTSDVAQQFARDADVMLKQTMQEWLPMVNVSLGEIISFPSIMNAGIEDTEKSMATMDAIALPLAFGILGYVVRSARLLILPLFTVATSLAVAFGIMYVVGLHEQVQMSTPSIMMSLLIAMSIDYSLFLLSRFREELEGDLRFQQNVKRRVDEAVQNMMRTAGFTVLLSGFTLMLSFFIICIFPVDIISSMGQGCATALMVAMLVHLTFIPACLSTFPVFFSKCARVDGGLLASGVSMDTMNSGPSASHTSLSGEYKPPAPTVFVKLGKIATSYPMNAVIVAAVSIATLAVGACVSQMNISNNLVMSVPHGNSLFDAMESLTASFGSGTVTPYKLIMEPMDPMPPTVFNSSFWKLSQEVLMEMTDKLPHSNPKDYNFASRAQGINIPWFVVAGCRNPNGTWPILSGACKMVNYPIKEFVNSDGTAMFGYIILSSFEPMGNDGPEWLRQARALLKDFEQRRPGIRLTLAGEAANCLDIMNKTYAIFPYMIALTMLCAVVVLGLAFRSVVVPVRSLITTLLTLAWVYGSGVLTYQYGAMQWTGLWGLTNKFDGQYWMMPVICFSMVVGICLDYDIFLLSRVAEKREEGLDPNEAIRQGLNETGGIICAAGIIMAIAFAGLMFTSMLLINLMSFYMVVAVLYDTFVVSCILSPAMMSLLGRHHWYPSPLGDIDFSGSKPDQPETFSPISNLRRGRIPLRRKGSGSST